MLRAGESKACSVAGAVSSMRSPPWLYLQECKALLPCKQDLLTLDFEMLSFVLPKTLKHRDYRSSGQKLSKNILYQA